MESTLTRLKCIDVHGRGYRSDDMIPPDLPTKDFVYIFFRGCRLSYWCVPVLSLLSPSPAPSHLVTDVESAGVYIYCYRMSCVRSKSWIYLIGGHDWDGKTSKGNEETEEDFSIHTSAYLMRFAILPPILTGDPSCCEKSQMHSGKGLSHIAVEHNDIIYVLADFFTHIPKHTFEAYNPREDRWYVLDSPPTHGLVMEEGLDWMISYVVIGNKICVSTEYEAFSYDVVTKEWEPCHLFDGVQPYYSPKNVDGSYLVHVGRGSMR